MCGRFTTTIDLEEIARHFNIDVVEGDYQPLYNAAPSMQVPVVVGNQSRKLSFFRWGLVPSWANDTTIGNKLINARAETLADKPSFRRAYQQRRCLIPADGFFEWKKEKKSKIPYRIIMRNNAPFGLAGLWEVWSPPGGTPLYSCTIITTEANALLRPIHDRMPVIIKPQEYRFWLDTAIQEPFILNRLLQPYPPEEMDIYEVSPLVNSPLNNLPEVIKPV